MYPLGEPNTLVIPIYKVNPREYDDRLEKTFQAKFSEHEARRPEGSSSLAFDDWRKKYGPRIDMTQLHPPWKFNQIWGYLELFRSGHWIKCVLHEPQKRRGTPRVIAVGAKVGEALIRRDTQKGVKDAVLQVVKQAERCRPKDGYIDLNVHLLDSLNLKRFFQTPRDGVQNGADSAAPPHKK